MIGTGAIGGVIASWLDTGRIPGHRLVGTLTRSGRGEQDVATFDDLLALAPGLVIEAASQEAARTYVPLILAAGRDCLMLSVGAFSDHDFETRCRSLCTGESPRLLISTGAIGGIDALRAMHLGGGLKAVTLTSTVHAPRLVQPWMSARETQRLGECDHDFIAFEGTAREAASHFPRLTNIGATIALATLGLDTVTVKLIAGTGSDTKVHKVHAVSTTSELRLRLDNRVAPENPHTSALAPMSVIRHLTDTGSAIVIGV
jgi:aspartate dehydrogenase